MNFISICSGIEAASVAFGPLGWKAIAFSEIEGFPSAVLAHHYPTVRNYGDMSLFRDWPDGLFADADAIVGGPPCQAFSCAGARRGLLDARGNLTLIYVELLDHADDIRRKYGKPPIVALYENVPGIFSDRTNAFGCLVGGLAGEDVPVVPPGKRWTDAGCVFGPERAVAWRLFDAQFFALAQRRRRVFVVASARPGFDPAAVLFEWHGLRRDTAPSREAGQNAAGSLTASAGRRGGVNDPERGQLVGTVATLDASFGRLQGASGQDANHGHSHLIPQTTHILRGEGFDASEDGTGRGTPLVPVVSGTLGANHGNVKAEHAWTGQLVATAIRTANTSANGHGISPELAHTLDRAQGQCVAFPARMSQCAISENVALTLVASNPTAVAFQERGRKGGRYIDIGGEVADALTAPSGGGRAQERNVMTQTMQVRRLTPEECEALQGFPRGYTRIPGWSGWRDMDATETPEQCAAEGIEVRQNKRTGKWRVKDVDGPRYKALGNSWAVPCARWIGQRIQRAMRGAAQ